METAIINTIDLGAAAADVQAKFAAMIEDMADLVETAKAIQIQQDAANDIRNNYEQQPLEDYRVQLLAEADFELSQPLIWAIETVAKGISREAEKVARAVETRSKAIAKTEAYVTREEARRSIVDSMNAAKNVEPLDSGFFLISSAIESEGKGRDKYYTAKIVFLLNGNAYQIRVSIDGKTRQMGSHHNYDLGHRFFDLKAETFTDLFVPDMDEDAIRKAAHIIAGIRAAFTALLTPADTAAAA